DVFFSPDINSGCVLNVAEGSTAATTHSRSSGLDGRRFTKEASRSSSSHTGTIKLISGGVTRPFSMPMRHVIKARKDSNLLSQIKKTRYIQTLGVDVFFGEASFVSPDETMLDGQRLRGENFVIAAIRAESSEVRVLAAFWPLKSNFPMERYRL